MKTKVLLMFFLLSHICLFADTDSVNNNNKRIIIANSNGRPNPHMIEPLVYFMPFSSTITVDFGDQPVGNYCVTISSPLVDVDYYATSPFTTIPIAVDGINDYNIIIETDDGDIFEGTLLATDCHPTERV